MNNAKSLIDTACKTVVISQPMYFPWCGLLDQIRQADVFVHYDDVQLSRGFYNRVQVRTRNGFSWLSVPLKGRHQGQLIRDALISHDHDWVSRHRNILINSYRKARFLDDAIQLFDNVHRHKFDKLADLDCTSIEQLANYFGVGGDVLFLRSSQLDIPGSSSQRLLDITKKVGGSRYVTGHGAMNYLDHELFEASCLDVHYMDYSIADYQHVSGEFTPYATALDAIAHLGPEARTILMSSTRNWRMAIERPEELRA